MDHKIRYFSKWNEIRCNHLSNIFLKNMLSKYNRVIDIGWQEEGGGEGVESLDRMSNCREIQWLIIPILPQAGQCFVFFLWLTIFAGDTMSYF